MAQKVMIADFDSVAQKQKWAELAGAIEGAATIDSTDVHTLYTLEKKLNDHPELASYFASVARTAYLYSSTICLSVPQLFDGIFFLALGPDRINGIMGKSYKDAPPFTLSNKGETPFKAFLSHFFSCEWDEEGAHLIKCRLKVFDYSSFNFKIGEEQVNQQSADFNKELCAVLQAIGAQWDAQEPIDSDVLSLVPTPTGLNKKIWHLLWKRWALWFNAFMEGKIAYQNPEETNKKTGVETKENPFERMFKQVLSELSEAYNQMRETEDTQISDVQHAEFRNAIDSLCKYQRRVAFLANEHTIIKNYEQASGKDYQEDKLYSEAALGEIYEYAYQAGIAASNDANLLAVSLQTRVIAPALEKLPQSHCLFLSGKITDEFSQMPYTFFSELLYRHRALITSWRDAIEAGDIKERRKLKHEVEYAILTETEESSYASDLKDTEIQLVVSLAIAIPAVLFEIFDIAGNIPIILSFLLLLGLEFGPDVAEALLHQYRFKSTAGTIIHLSN